MTSVQEDESMISRPINRKVSLLRRPTAVECLEAQPKKEQAVIWNNGERWI